MSNLFTKRTKNGNTGQKKNAKEKSKRNDKYQLYLKI